MGLVSNVIGDLPGCWATLNERVRLGEGGEWCKAAPSHDLVAPLAVVDQAVASMKLALPEALVLQVAFLPTGHGKLFMSASDLVIKGCDGGALDRGREASALCPTTRPPPDPVTTLFLAGPTMELTKGIGLQVSDTEAEAMAQAAKQLPTKDQIFWIMRVVAAWTLTEDKLQAVSLPDLVGRIITIPVTERPCAAV